jgi:hypothetical protein
MSWRHVLSNRGKGVVCTAQLLVSIYACERGILTDTQALILTYLDIRHGKAHLIHGHLGKYYSIILIHTFIER